MQGVSERGRTTVAAGERRRATTRGRGSERTVPLACLVIVTTGVCVFDIVRLTHLLFG